MCPVIYLILLKAHIKYEHLLYSKHIIQISLKGLKVNLVQTQMQSWNWQQRKAAALFLSSTGSSS